MSISPKEFLFEDEAREKLREGVDALVTVAAVTLGPRGHNVAIDESLTAPEVTTDGYTAIASIELKDLYANMGAQMAKEAALKMRELCGDGTTTMLILLRSLVQEGLRQITAGASPVDIQRGIDGGVKAVIRELGTLATPLVRDEAILSVATAAAGGDAEIGRCVAEAVGRVGGSGAVVIKEGKTTEMRVEIVPGFQLSQGYVSPQFATDPQTLTALLHRPRIAITSRKISSVQEILPLLDLATSGGYELLLIAGGLEGDALSTLVVNQLRGTVRVCAIEAPGSGVEQLAILEDLATLTGGSLLSDETGTPLRGILEEHLGHAESVTMSDNTTVIVGGGGSRESIQRRVRRLEKEFKQAKNAASREALLKRKGMFAEEVAVIRVGASSEIHLKGNMEKLADGLAATMSALEEGVVPGGGIALIHAAAAAANYTPGGPLDPIFSIVVKACAAPFRYIVESTGHDAPPILEDVLAKGIPFGFNAVTETVEDLYLAEIVYPVKIQRLALLHAAATAGVILLTETAMIPSPAESLEGSNE
jgi:chaperonin GroEL